MVRREILDRNVERKAARVQVRDDGLALPVPVGVDDIAPVALVQKGGVITIIRRPWLAGMLDLPWANADGVRIPLGSTDAN